MVRYTCGSRHKTKTKTKKGKEKKTFATFKKNMFWRGGFVIFHSFTACDLYTAMRGRKLHLVYNHVTSALIDDQS